LTNKIDTCHQNNNKSFTNPYEEHQACGYGYKVVCHGDRSYSKPVKIYRRRNVAKNFIENIDREAESCKEIIKKTF